MSFPDNEPAVTVGGISALAAAILAVLVAFGAQITPDQQKAILGLVAVVAPIIAAVVIRQFVTPSAKVDRNMKPAKSTKEMAEATKG